MTYVPRFVRWFDGFRRTFGRLISGGSITVVREAGTASAHDVDDLLGGYGTPESALRSAAVWACCRVIANSISTLPLHIFEETDTGKVKAYKHPLYKYITSQPNPMMTTQQWIGPTMIHLLLQGEGFTFIDKLDGQVIGLWPMTPADVDVTIGPDRMAAYVFKRSSEPFTIPDDQIIHFRLFTLDGIRGLSVLDYHRDTFAFEQVADAYSASVYLNGGQPSGVLRYPGVLKPDQADSIRNSWNSRHGGFAGRRGVAVLEQGGEYQAIGVTMQQLEYMADKKFTIEQIARIFGVAPHLIGSMDKPTYASVEQQSLEFLRYTLQPWVISLEKSIDAKLLEYPYLTKFNINGFERSDIKTRYQSYATARQWGWLSVNDIRELEDMNRIGEGGDTYLEPLNMVPAATATEPMEA